ncbi:MAG: sorbosone dehydrogenase family protein [Vicinamibacterales bacterium]
MTKPMMRAAVLTLVTLCGIATGTGRAGRALAQTPASAAPPVERLSVPAGFVVEVYAANVPMARQLAVAPSGTVFVGAMRLGGKGGQSVHALVDRNRDGKVDEVVTVASGLESPNGVAFHNGALYVAEFTRILRFDNVEANLGTPQTPQVVIDKLPGNAQHGWKTIRFGPDGKLYVTIGAPCNVCEVKAEEPRTASIARMNPDGTGFEIVVRGVRNSVGLAWHPTTRELWYTNNGRDMLGDDLPPDTLNRVTKPGQDFGFPYCHAGDIPDPEFSKVKPCGTFTPPAQKLGAHVASLGLAFYTGPMFPAEYRHQVFIAEHGSWNRSKKSGYRVTLVRLDEQGRAVGYEPFMQGWLEGEKAWGRPADVAVLADGSLLVSDDTANAVYRVRYRR